MELPEELKKLQIDLANIGKQFDFTKLPASAELGSIEPFESPFKKIADTIEYLNAMILAVKSLSGIDQKDFERQILAELTAIRTKKDESSSGSELK